MNEVRNLNALNELRILKFKLKYLDAQAHQNIIIANLCGMQSTNYAKSLLKEEYVFGEKDYLRMAENIKKHRAKCAVMIGEIEKLLIDLGLESEVEP